MLLLFKDSSGTDEVALSGRMHAGVTLLRGGGRLCPVEQGSRWRV